MKRPPAPGLAQDYGALYFERFFGFARPWSASDYVIYENLHAPKLWLELQPLPGLRVDAGYGAIWLASDTDRFNNLLAGTAFNRDARGLSGKFRRTGVRCARAFCAGRICRCNTRLFVLQERRIRAQAPAHRTGRRRSGFRLPLRGADIQPLLKR